MTDSVGNSYFLAGSTAPLVVSRKLQESLTQDYEQTDGAYAQAYLNHGIKPAGDSYQYVVIPADSDATKLNQLAFDPSGFYQVLDTSGMHLVRFPEQDLTAYAFYEVVETPAGELLRTVSQSAAVIVQELEGTSPLGQAVAQASPVRLAASVPDMGWAFEDDIVSRGLGYASKHFAFQVAKEHTLTLTLRGTWCPDETGAPPGTESTHDSGETVLRLRCRDGMSTEVVLQPCATADAVTQGEQDAPEPGLRGPLDLRVQPSTFQ